MLIEIKEHQWLNLPEIRNICKCWNKVVISAHINQAWPIDIDIIDTIDTGDLLMTFTAT